MGNFLQPPTASTQGASSTPGVTSIYNASVPVGIPSSGSIGNNGALTGLGAFATTYPSIYLFFPAGAIAAGSAAGFYLCQMSSASAGTIFNNPLPTGTKPTIPASPTPFVTTGPGAYTQSVTSQVLSQVAVSAGAIVSGALVEIFTLFSTRSTGGAKNFNLLFGGTSIGNYGNNSAGSFYNLYAIYNQQTNRQVLVNGGAAQFYGVTTPANKVLTVDTTSTFNIEIDGNIAVATDWLVLEGFTVRATAPT